ncbi:MAG: XRE family transcriptional regulator [Tannerella sp.]|jgi:hypothetical protein|nr:XRE family transcriptional regulator [Tannerella sp.]
MKKTHWTEHQKKTVLDNIGRLSIEEIAFHVDRTPRAVRLFLHRNKITLGETVKHNLVITVLQRKFGHPEYFTPTKQFFIDVKINQKRYWDLYYGRKQISQEEYERLCSHLNIPPEDSFEARQMEIFK